MRWRALVAVVPLVVLAACAPSPAGSADSGTTGSDTGTTDTTSSAVELGPTIPADTAVAEPVDAALMPTATGKFGEKPTITIPSTPAPTTLQRQILSKGSGAEVVKGDWLQVNYLGQVWGGDVFDNSYDRKSLFTFQIGADTRSVVAGWDVGLLGTTVGSRVLLSFPSQDGYGKDGSGSNIPGGATLIFVVDVVNLIGPDVGGQADATPQTAPTDIATVTGDLGKMPTIKIPSGLAEPTKERTVVLAKGTGAPVVAGNILFQYSVITWDGTDSESSWPGSSSPASGQAGPREMQLDASQTTFASLLGVPIGSRVYMEMPADSSTGNPALAWVIDLVLQADVTADSTTGTASASDTAGATDTAAPGTSAAPTS